MQQSLRRQGAGSEVAGLKARYGALRQAAALPGADPATLLEAALAELDAAVAALTPDGDTDEHGDGGQGSSAASHGQCHSGNRDARRGYSRVPGRSRRNLY